MSQEDVDWIRTRAKKLEHDGMDYTDAFVKACQEREEHLRRTTKKAKRTRHPLRVTLADLVKETKK